MRWKAVTQLETGSFLGIVTVRAHTRTQAKEETRRQLSKNPSRRQALKAWENDGAIVIPHELYLKQ